METLLADQIDQERKREDKIVEREIIKDLLSSASTLEYRSVITSVFIDTLNTELPSDYRDRVCNVYIGLMDLMNHIDERP